MNAAAELLPRTHQEVALFSETERGLAELRQQLEGVEFDCTTTKGNQDARQARKVLVGLRSAVEGRRKELKEPLLQQGRDIDAEAERIKGEIIALEKPIDDIIRADEKRREEERAERQRQEEARIAAIIERIEQVRRIPLAFVNATATEVDEEIHRLTDVDVTEGMGDAHAEQAKAAQVEALRTLGDMHTAKLNAEALASELEAARLRQEERAREQEAQNAAERERQAEQQRLFEEERRAEEARNAAERERQAEQQRLFEDERRAEEARQASERAELERLRREEEERQRIERDRIAAERAEEERRIAEERKAAEIEEEQRKRRLAQVQHAGPELASALQALLRRFVVLVESGDAGHWEAEKEDVVINARAALSKAGIA